jgi:SulP family sulfate permease
MAFLFAVFSDVPFVIAGPDSKPAAVLAALAAATTVPIVGRTATADEGVVLILVLVAGTLTTGLVLLLLGIFKMGRWIRFVPFPVIAGFMAASGWFLAVGGLHVLAASAWSWNLLWQVAAGQHAPQLIVGLVLALAGRLTRRFNNPLALPAVLVGGSLAVHAGLVIAGYSPADARAAGWLMDLGAGIQWPGPALLATINTVDLSIFLRASGDYVALVVVTAMTLLLSMVAIEVETRQDLDLDREMRLNGLANLLVGLAAGMVGTVSVSRTLFNYRTGARDRTSGMLAGAICLASFALGSRVLSAIPVPVLGALLVQIGTEMLGDWLIKIRRSMQPADYVQVVIIFLVIVAWNFVGGVVVGVITACITFAVNTSRIRLVKLGLDRSTYGSRVDRPSFQQEELVRHGNRIQIIWLHGFIFFGSAHRLLQHIQDLVRQQDGTCRSIILDFRQVLGIDSSAAMSLTRLRQFAEREGFAIIFSEMPPHVERVLRVSGVLRGGDGVSQVFANLDSALEWCEDQLLSELMSAEDALRSTEEWLASEIGSKELLARLLTRLEKVDYQAGAHLFTQGEQGDSLYLLYAGRVTVLYRTPEGAQLRLRSLVGHTVVGEMGLYRTMPRGASVRADVPTAAYRLSRTAMQEMEQHDPALASAFHRFIVRMLAARVDFANREIAGLQR